MVNTSDDKSRARAEQEAGARDRRRAVSAQIVSGLQGILEKDEQLLGFTRGMVAGGLRGKLTVGFEALFAPHVNLGLTERRIVLQHVQPESGKPNEILPHSFPLSELQSILFSDIETFGGEPAARLTLRLFSDQHFRLRFREREFVENARQIAEVFKSLTATRPASRTSPTQSICPHCDRILDRPFRFCPYCGQSLETLLPAVQQPADAAADAAESERPIASDDWNVAAAASPEPAAPLHAEADLTPAPEWTGTEAPAVKEAAALEAASEVEIETIAPETGTEMATEGKEIPQHSNEPGPTAREGEHAE